MVHQQVMQEMQVKCAVCGDLAEINRVSFQADGKTYMETAVHDETKLKHSWTTYTPDKYLVIVPVPAPAPVPVAIPVQIKRVRSRPNPQYMICPKCHQMGRVNKYHSDEKVRYYVKHEQRDGYWGRDESKKMRKYRRCYFSESELMKDRTS